MPDIDSRKEERRGTRKLFVWAVLIGALLLIAVSLWPLLPGPETGPANTRGPSPPETTGQPAR